MLFSNKRGKGHVMYLLTGGSGVLGTALQRSAALHGIEYLAPSSIVDINISSPPHYVMSQDLRGIVHCAAYTDVPGAETYGGRQKAVNLNILGARNVKHWGSTYGIPVIYISTDYVYPGDTGNYSENDVVRPINYYACTKLMGEAFMDHACDLIIRTSFKPNTPWPYPRAFDDLYSSADYVDVIADKISFLLNCFPDPELVGIINVGTERKSIYELARKRNTRVKPMSRKEIKNVYLPSDTSLDTTKYDNFYDLVTGD